MAKDEQGNDARIVGRAATVIGGGPAGLMAAEVLSAAGVKVDLYDAMPSPGRKFLLAGRGGLNLTHAEPASRFNSRFRAASPHMAPALEAFDAQALRAWVHQLGVETFVGSSQRVFPVGMKAAPLLRAWLRRLREAGVVFHMRHRWLGWTHRPSDALRFATPHGEIEATADAVVLALGGGSWARLGSDGCWVPILRDRGVDVEHLVPANCGFDIAWSRYFQEKYAGQPLKSIVASVRDIHGQLHTRAGELLITASGIEGSLAYAFSAELRELIATNDHAILNIDLNPERSTERVTLEITHPRGAKSLTSHLQSRVGISGIKAGLLREILGKNEFHNLALLAASIKTLSLKLTATKPIDEAISTAGGVRFDAMDENSMLRAVPGTFCAGEMLDWEAPTGGYLLTGCFATGRSAGQGAVRWLEQNPT
ncbi:MAG: TIGR03862 family flavoprotein [Pseudomonadota bacterium]